MLSGPDSLGGIDVGAMMKGVISALTKHDTDEAPAPRHKHSPDQPPLLHLVNKKLLYTRVAHVRGWAAARPARGAGLIGCGCEGII